MTSDAMIRGAVLSECGRYRYSLIRRWGDGPTCGFIMLNPSVADAEVDDPTIRRCIGFAQREGCGALVVVNLFPLRATDPRDLFAASDPLGIDSDDRMLLALRDVDGPLIAAWGAHGTYRGRGAYVAAMFGPQLSCLGLTKGGHPRHPLYVRADAPLVPYGTAEEPRHDG